MDEREIVLRRRLRSLCISLSEAYRDCADRAAPGSVLPIRRDLVSLAIEAHALCERLAEVELAAPSRTKGRE